VARPSRLCFAERRMKEPAVAQIYLKREDLNHSGADKINSCIGQALLARRMGKPRLIAETGAGQHGVATATAAALFGFQCQVYMGEEDVRRQKLNVFKMRAMGAEVVSVTSGSRTLRDAINEAMRDWMATVENTHYIIGSVVGPHPFPMMVRDFQAVIGEETKQQCREQIGRLPDVVIAWFRKLEGILPALETAHGVVEAMRIAAKRSHNDVVVVCFSGRGDKDCFEVARLMGENIE